MAVGKKGDVFFQKCSAFTPSNFYDRSSICRSFGVPVPPSRKQVERCGQGSPRKRRGAGLGMGDDGRDGDEASHGTLSLSPPGTRVIGSDRRSERMLWGPEGRRGREESLCRPGWPDCGRGRPRVSAPAGSRGFPPAAASLRKTERGNRCICMSSTHSTPTGAGAGTHAPQTPPPGRRLDLDRDTKNIAS